jgi:chromosome segregation ATPase
MTRERVERRLVELTARLRQRRADLEVADEQLAHLDEEADDARLRSLVSETPLAGREHREAQRHADAMRRHHHDLQTQIAAIEREQDDLLDQLVAGRPDTPASRP